MATQQKKSSSSSKGNSGGRTASSDPKIQVFQQFAGCNFQASPRTFTLGQQPDHEQTDLQMNYVVIQNNASITDNKTIETRSNLVKLFDAPKDTEFTDASILVGGELYIACTDQSVRYGKLGESLDGTVKLTDKSDSKLGHNWKSFAYIDNQIVGATDENLLWTGELGSYELSNAKKVPDPGPLTLGNLVPRGSLKISSTMNDDPELEEKDRCTNRITVAYTYVNKFGPTKTSDQFAFYANYPVDEWHSGCFLQIQGIVPGLDGDLNYYDIKAVEIYYSEDNSSSLLFAGRTDLIGAGKWIFSWLGYLNATNMWTIANLIAPKENYTEGVKASRMKCIDSRMYYWGCKDEPYRLYIGGNPGNLFSVSSATGGGFVDVEPGSGQEIRYVDKYKTQSGNSIVTMLCDSSNSSKEQRYNLVENTVSISNEQSMKSWQAEQVAGAVGCKSWHGAEVCEDGLYSVSRYGIALTTQTMEYNSQIRANYVSAPIKPVFTDKRGSLLKNAVMLECDGVLYMTFGKQDKEHEELDNLLFCYDIDLKAWWTISLDVDNEPIIDMLHIDWEDHQEGIGFVTTKHVFLLPLTQGDSPEDKAKFETLIQTGELSTTMPQQGWQYLSQLEFRFDHFVGELEVEVDCIDQFGRRIKTRKTFSHNEVVYNLAEHMRVDLRVQSYKITMRGKANFRLSHFMAKVYTMSTKVGLVWGFNDSMSYRSNGDIHPTFKDYNDIRRAIIP